MKIKSRETLIEYMTLHDMNAGQMSKKLRFAYTCRALNNLKNGNLPFSEKHELFFLGAQTKGLIP